MWMLLLDLWCPIVMCGFGLVGGVQWLMMPKAQHQAFEEMPTIIRTW